MQTQSLIRQEVPQVPWSLVVCRSQGRSPWYLLTPQPIETEEQAWRVVYAYVRRWQIELSGNYEKSELADHQSARLRGRSTREMAGALLLSPHGSSLP
jgi:hypothetical protein